MKKLNLLFLAILLIGFASCKDEDPTQQELIIGAWNINSVVYSDCTDPDDDFTDTYGMAGCADCETTTFTFTAPSTLLNTYSEIEDGMVVESETETGSYSFSETVDNELTICLDGECFTGTLTVTENSMTWVTNIQGCTATINASK